MQDHLLIRILVLGSFLLEIRVESPYVYVFCSVSLLFAAAHGAIDYCCSKVHECGYLCYRWKLSLWGLLFKTPFILFYALWVHMIQSYCCYGNGGGVVCGVCYYKQILC